MTTLYTINDDRTKFCRLAMKAHSGGSRARAAREHRSPVSSTRYLCAIVIAARP